MTIPESFANFGEKSMNATKKNSIETRLASTRKWSFMPKVLPASRIDRGSDFGVPPSAF